MFFYQALLNTLSKLVLCHRIPAISPERFCFTLFSLHVSPHKGWMWGVTWRGRSITAIQSIPNKSVWGGDSPFSTRTFSPCMSKKTFLPLQLKLVLFYFFLIPQNCVHLPSPALIGCWVWFSTAPPARNHRISIAPLLCPLLQGFTALKLSSFLWLHIFISQSPRHVDFLGTTC